MCFKFSIVCSLVLIILAGASRRDALAHAYPASASPAEGSTVTEPPQEIRIQFTEGVELEFSRIDVKNAAGERFTQGKLRKIASDTLAIDMKPLSAGSYTIEWQVLSVDTHVTEGLLHFIVKP
jgi:methionine-rich copper-binding protein CopC